MPDQPRIYSVSALTAEIRGLLEGGFQHVSVEGELSNFRPSSTGHYYFSLKDREAVLSGVMFRNSIGRLDFAPADGDKVVAEGRISVYAQRGSYQLICESMQKAGVGELLALLEERKRRLAAEGLFDAERKKPLPRFPSRIAVITSPTGAALRDILQVLGRRHAGIDVVILPTAVQGDGADEMIAAQLRRAGLHRMGEVVILARGGGSLEDLLPFSSELVVRAIAASPLPVISAVGHEIDFSLADLAADLRAPTPSAAAEVVSAEREETLRGVALRSQALAESMQARLERIRLGIAPFAADQIERNMRILLQPCLLRFDDAKEAILAGMRLAGERTRSRFELALRTVEASSPLDNLKRGYAIVRQRASRAVVASADQLRPGDPVSISFHKGEADAEIQTIRPAEELRGPAETA